jgi:hypothetical protein
MVYGRLDLQILLLRDDKQEGKQSLNQMEKCSKAAAADANADYRSASLRRALVE